MNTDNTKTISLVKGLAAGLRTAIDIVNREPDKGRILAALNTELGEVLNDLHNLRNGGAS